jgi:uncharacterized membrane protein
MAVHQIDDAEIRRVKAVVYILSAIVLVSVSALVYLIGKAC